MLMNANEEMLAGNADADASYPDSDATYCIAWIQIMLLSPGFVTVIFVSYAVLK